MKIKSLILLLLCGLLSFSGMAQKKTHITSFSSNNYTAEMLDYLNEATSDKEKVKANQTLMQKFESAWSSMNQGTRDRVVAISDVVLKLKVRQIPDVYDFVSVMTTFYNSSSDKSNFNEWLSSIEYIQSRNKKVKDFTDFIAFTNGLLADRTLYGSRSSMWQTQAGIPFKLELRGQDIVVSFSKPMELYYSSDKDNGTIYGTTGDYYYFDFKWVGKGGRLNWDRTGIPPTACWAVLDNYQAITKFPKFSADSVKFTNTNYFSEPIYGKVEESLSAKMDPEKYTFPKFRSYQTDFRLKDILPGVDYSGSFMMNGARFITSDNVNPATMIFYRDGKKFATVTSTKFTITHNRIVSELASVKMYVGQDSIFNDGILVRYLADTKQLIMVNDSKRNYYSPYNNTYHNLDMYCEQIVWKQNEDKLYMSMLGQSGDQTFSTFESRSYYSEGKFREIQGIDEVNPVIRVYKYIRKEKTREFFVEEFAQTEHMDILQAKSMVHNLAHSGLVSFNEAAGKVFVKEKLLAYARAYGKNKDGDYDALVLESSTKNSNAVINLSDNNLEMHGVKKFVVSDSQQVVIYPNEGDLVVKKNRDIDFSGKINAGRFIAYVTNASFLYNDFRLELPQVDSMVFYVTQFNDPEHEHIVYTPLYNLVGNIQIDAPNNHSGLKETKDFPIFTSTKESYVYYDKKQIHNGAYKKDIFYFKLRPFTITNMVNFVTDSLSFGGVLTSGGIFPDIDEPLKVQKDYSLGFVRKTPKDGYNVYGGKGKYISTIDLSYKGLRGQGEVDYLTSITKSKSIYFMPDSMVALTDTFFVKELSGYPDIRNGRAVERWYPKADSMLISQEKNGSLFKMYHNDALLAGHVILKPSGALAGGAVTIKEGTVESRRFELKPMDMLANVSTFTLRSDVYKNIAFYATDMKSHVDYKKRVADFTSNQDLGRTQLPLLQYAAYVDKFSWQIDKKELDLINSKSEATMGMEGLAIRERLSQPVRPGALFVSTNPSQDSLNFNAIKGVYHYDAGRLSCKKVFLVDVADAVVAPAGDSLYITAGGSIKVLNNSQLLANRENKYHLIYKSDILIEGAKKYSAKGYLDYVDENEKKQAIYLTDISPNNSGVSVGQGFISDSAKFTLSSAFGFAGKVRMEADKQFLYFDGGVRLLHGCVPDEQKGLLAFSGYLDPNNIQVTVPEIPTDWKGNRITASILLDPTTRRPYPAFLTNDRAADNELMGAWGMLTFDKNTHEYMISSAKKIEDGENVVEKYLKMNTETCTVEGEGPVDFSVKQNLVKLFAFGNSRINNSHIEQTELNTVFGFTFPLDDGVQNAMTQFILDDLRLTASNADNDNLRKAMIYYQGEENGSSNYSTYVATGAYEKMPKEFESTLLFENINWQYSPTLGFYYNGVASLAAVGKKQVHLQMRVKAQFYKRGNGVYLILYLQPATDHWYYFCYEFNSQQMSIQSSVGEWVDMIKSLPVDKRQISGKETGNYYYKITPSRSEVPNFLLRMDGQQEGDEELEEDVIEGDE